MLHNLRAKSCYLHEMYTMLMNEHRIL